MKRFILLSLLMMFSNSLLAKQQYFNKKDLGDAYQFSYRWLDHKKINRELSFPLEKSVLFQRFRHFKRYQKKLARMSVNKRILMAWNENPPKNSQLKLIKKQGVYELLLSADSTADFNQAQAKIAELTKQATKAYLTKEHYHSFTTQDGIEGIKPDHVAITDISKDDFKSIKPLILEQVDLKNIRTATNYVLGLVQSIPYATLESRLTSSGAGFNPPAKLLWENQGDCDSKVTLTATILRALMPRVKMIFIFIDGHALLGIETRTQADDKTLNVDGVDYILSEPTGPSILALGKISFDSNQAILNGMFVTEAVK